MKITQAAAPNALQTEEEQLDYNARVKKNLIAWRDSFEEANCGAKLNYSAIAQRMERDFKITTSSQKISAMFDSQSTREVKLQEIAALCQIFSIPIQDICEYPNAPVSDVESLVKRKNAKQNTVQQLNNPLYHGTYYCYYFKAKHYQDKLKPVEESGLKEAVMQIIIEKGSTVITFKEKKTEKNFFGDKTVPSFTLKGKLYHFENTDMAYSFLTDETGRRAIALMFTYLNLSADIRYYITAGMMTFALNQTHVPLFQKMAIFKVPQNIHEDREQADVIRGILALNTCPIVLDEETLACLASEDKAMGRLVNQDTALKKCYIFSETAVRSAAYFITDDDLKMQKILKLRRNSLYPAHEIVSEPDYFTDFIKHYQQAQLEEDSVLIP